MNLDEELRMRMLEEALQEIRRIDSMAEKDNQSMSFEEALEGPLLKAWLRVKRQMNMLLP